MMDHEHEKQNTFFRFEDLRVYHKAMDYISWVNDTTNMFPENLNNDLVLKWNRSAQAIALNIAEGSARNKSQFIYYLKMAKSALRESLVYTSISRNLNYVSDTQETASREFLMELTKMIGALISSLQRPTNKHHVEDEIDEKIEVNAY